MGSHLELIRQNLNGATIKASGQAIGFAVAVTDAEIITGNAGLFGRWGAKLQRFPLSNLTSLRVSPNPNANLLTLEFTGNQTVRVMYGSDEQAAFDEIIAVLRQRLNGRESGGR